MTDGKETPEDKINRNVEALRQTFEPLAADLTPEVEPAVIYRPQQPANDHS
jgi:hypothetical protein